MGKRYFIAVIMLLCILIEPFICSAIRINEIMYNPIGDDNNKEFVELYMETWTNISGWKMADSDSNDTLQMIYYSETNPNYALVTEEGFNFAGIDATIYSAGASIGNNLGNSVDSIYLYDLSGAMVDSASYDGTMANGNGKTMEFLEDIGWEESYTVGGTPGKANFRPENDQNQTNSTGNTTNSTNPTDMDECKAIIVAYTDKETYNITDKVNIHFALYNDSFPYTIEYWIEDSIGNIVKEKYNTTNTNTKTWTPELDEKDGIFYLKSNLYLGCGDELRESSSESMFIVFNNDAARKTDSSITIEEVYTGSDSKIEFGQILKVKAEIYKGDESSSTVEFSVENNEGEKASQTASALFYSRFTKYDITVPIQLKPNCDSKLKDGTYIVVLEGLGLREEKEVDIEGITKSLCPDAGSSSSSSTAAAKTSSASSATAKTADNAEETKITYQLLNFKSELAPKEQVLNELLIQNDEEPHTFDVWSYVYRGSKSYSGEREANRQSIELSAYESAIVELENSIDNANAGDYKFKVKVKKDNQKTNYEMTEDVEILNQITAYNLTNTGEINPGLKSMVGNSSMAAGSVVYEGQAAKSKKLSIVFLIVSVFLVSLIGLRNWLQDKRPKKGQKRADKSIKNKNGVRK